MIALPAPAKLNLFLHVTGRREDGYHLLESVFQLVDFSDTVHLGKRDDGAIVRVNDIPGVPADTDLSVRAALALQQATGVRFGADIRLDKHIPMGGGLGGGSSDAATVLLGLNRLWQLDLPRLRLMEIGLTLGADVPFFVFGQNAFACGVGEKLVALRLPARWFVVIKPHVEIRTADIFRAPELTRNAKSVKMADFSAGLSGPAYSFSEPMFRNDLQEVAQTRHSQVAEALAWFRQGCLASAEAAAVSARMSGSGACVFAGFGSAAAAEKVFAQRPSGWDGFVARGLQQHPLAGLADL